MLTFLRAAANSWFTKIFLGVVLLCFVLLWRTPGVKSMRSQDLFASGKSTINESEYLYTLNKKMLQASMALNLKRRMSRAEALQYGIPQLVANEELKDVLFDEQARLLKIGVSDQATARALSNESLFQTEAGFNAELFQNYARQLGINPATIVHHYARQQKRAQLIQALVGGIQAPKVLMKGLESYENQTRSAEYITLTPALLWPLNPPKDEALKAWYDAHKEQFQVPEYRAVSLLHLKANNIFKAEDVTPEEVTSFYNKNTNKFRVPESRSYEFAYLKTPQQAQAVVDNFRKDNKFQQALAQVDKTVSLMHKEQIKKDDLSPALAQTIFSLKKDTLSEPIADKNGILVIHLKDITAEHIKPIKEVESKIRTFLVQTHAQEKMRSLQNKIQKAYADGQTLDAIAKQFNLTEQKAVTDRFGKDKAKKPILALGLTPQFLQKIFLTKKDAKNPPFSDSQNGYIWYKVDAIEPTHIEAFETVKNTLITRWKKDETQRLLNQRAEDLLAKAKKEKNFDALCKELNLKKQFVSDVKRESTLKDFSPQAVTQLFSTPIQDFSICTGANEDSRILMHVLTVDNPVKSSSKTQNPKSDEQLKQTLKQDFIQIIAEMANKISPVSINQPAYQDMLQMVQGK